MTRIIRFEGREIRVPDDATDDEVRQILDGGPAATPAAQTAPVASDLPVPGSLGADGTVLPRAGETPVKAPEPDLVDTVLGALGYADDTGAIMADRFGEGAANLLGLPVDLINTAPVLANLVPGVSGVGPLSDYPVGGSKSLNDLRKGFGLIPDAPEPADPFQVVAGRVAEELGANAIPVGGVLAGAGRMGVEAIRESSPLTRMFLEQAAVSPARFVGREAAAATAAGTGAGTANLFVDRDTTEGQVADLTGALAGAGVAGIGDVVLRGLGNIAGAAFQKKTYIDQVVKEAVVDRLAKAAGLPGADNGAADVDPLIAAIMDDTSRVRPSELFPGYQESLADVTANPGIAALEYGRQSGPNAGSFAARRAENAKVVSKAMDEVQPVETPGTFRSALDEERDARLRQAADTRVASQDEFDRFIQTLVPQMGAEERGAAVRAGVSNAERAAREMESAVWRGINAEVDPAPLADAFDETRGGLTVARQDAISDMNPTIDIPRRLSEVPEGEAGSNVGPVDLQELLDMRSTMLKEQRDAVSAGDTNRAEAIGRFIDEVNGYISSDAVDESVRNRIGAAREVSRNVNETFNRPNDPLAEVLAAREGRPNVPDSAVARKFVQPDSGQASNIDRLLAQTDLSSHGRSVREALKDEILAGVDKGRMVGDPSRLDQYLNQFSRVFDRFPDLRDEIRQAAGAGRRFGAASTAEADLQAELGTPDGQTKGRGAVGRYLQFSDASSERAINEVLAAKDPGAAADELLSFIGDNPRAVEGAKAAFWQKLRTESQSVDNAQRSMDGKRAWRGDWMKSFLDKPSTRAVFDRLYRDDPEHAALIRQYADVLDNVDLRQRGKAPGTSGTAQGVNPVLTPETLQSRFYAYMRGQVSGTYLATSIAAVVARRAVRKAQTEAIERLTDEVLLNPEAAALLLKDNNPANRAALARKAKLWLGNEASTVLDLLDGQGEESEGGEE